MGGSDPAPGRVSIGIEAELLAMESPSAFSTSMTMGTESPESSAGNVMVSLETPGFSRSGVFDSTATERSPILANSRVVGNLMGKPSPMSTALALSPPPGERGYDEEIAASGSAVDAVRVTMAALGPPP